MLLLYAEEENANVRYLLKGEEIENTFYLFDDDKSFLAAFSFPISFKKARDRFGERARKITKLDELFSFLRKNYGEKIKIDERNLPINIYEKMQKHFEVEFYSAQLLKARMRKNEEEIEKIKKAVEIAREIIERIELVEGMTEKQVANQIKLIAMEKNVELAFNPIVASGKNSSYPHHKPEEKVIEPPVIIDIGVKYQGYCSDITRTFFGKEEEYAFLQATLQEAIDRYNSGEINSAREMNTFVAKKIAKEGFGEMPHSLGHGIGLEVHEMPFFSSQERFPENATIAIEPAFYLAEYGMRYEEDYAIKDGKIVPL